MGIYFNERVRRSPSAKGNSHILANSPDEAVEEFKARHFALTRLRNPEWGGSVELWHQLASHIEGKPEFLYYIGSRAFLEGEYTRAYELLSLCPSSVIETLERLKTFYALSLVTEHIEEAASIRQRYASQFPTRVAYLDSAEVKGIREIGDAAPHTLIQSDDRLITTLPPDQKTAEQIVMSRTNELLGGDFRAYARTFLIQVQQRVGFISARVDLEIASALEEGFDLAPSPPPR